MKNFAPIALVALELIALALVVIGAAMIYPPAGFIVAGIALYSLVYAPKDAS